MGIDDLNFSGTSEGTDNIVVETDTDTETVPETPTETVTETQTGIETETQTGRQGSIHGN